MLSTTTGSSDVGVASDPCLFQHGQLCYTRAQHDGSSMHTYLSWATRRRLVHDEVDPIRDFVGLRSDKGRLHAYVARLEDRLVGIEWSWRLLAVIGILGRIFQAQGPSTFALDLNWRQLKSPHRSVFPLFWMSEYPRVRASLTWRTGLT
jgi:hypothetical protein